MTSAPYEFLRPAPKGPEPDHFDRPYDPTQLERLTAHFESALELDRATIESKAQKKGEETPVFDPLAQQLVVNTPESVERPRDVPSAGRTALRLGSSALRGTLESRHIFKKENRQARKERKANVTAFLGKKMLNPRGDDTDLKKKLGWVGSHTLTAEDKNNEIVQDPLKFKDMGKTLFRKTDFEKKPNTLRPTSLSEKIMSMRLEAELEKKHKSEDRSRWLKTSYGTLKSGESYKLSLGERFVRSYRLNEATHLDRKAARAEKKIKRIVRKGTPEN